MELYPTPPSIAPFSPHTKLLIRSYGAENAASKIGCVNHKPSAEALGLDILPLLGGGCCKSRRGRGSEPLRSHPFAPKAGAKDGAPRFLRVESQQTHTAKPARVGHSALHMHGISMPASALLASGGRLGVELCMDAPLGDADRNRYCLSRRAVLCLLALAVKAASE